MKKMYMIALVGMMGMGAGCASDNKAVAPEKKEAVQVEEKKNPTNSTETTTSQGQPTNGNEASMKKEILAKVSSEPKFQSVQGELTEESGGKTTTVKYRMRLGKNEAMYIERAENGNVYQKMTYKDKVTLTLNPLSKTYRETQVATEPKLLPFVFKQDSYPMVEKGQWTISDANASFAGRKAWMIRGNGFEQWIDKETGLLLKNQVVDAKGNVMQSLQMKSIQFNATLGDDMFPMDIPKGYRDASEGR